MQHYAPLKAKLAATVCALLLSTSAFAQPGYGQSTGQYGHPGTSRYHPQQTRKYRPAPPMKAQKISAGQLKKFAAARKKVLAIRSQYTARLKSAKNQSKAAKLQHAATQKMIGAVQHAGLDVKTYNSIAMQVHRDPKLKKRLSAIQG